MMLLYIKTTEAQESSRCHSALFQKNRETRGGGDAETMRNNGGKKREEKRAGKQVIRDQAIR
jgi:hypothetical protein